MTWKPDPNNVSHNQQRNAYFWHGLTCQYCGVLYYSAKNRPGYCSDACKQRAYRARKQAK